MPWKEKSVEKMREEFVRQVLSKQKSKSELCREYGISRPTGDKWIQRYLNNEELSDRSKAPFKTANKTPEATEQFIV
ncbi:MAG: helix-turn-helix domain-containing protein, partial [Clostridia bacterium]|nr:helix-turn-helix domain-containing protein [Clostridia bacterium]